MNKMNVEEILERHGAPVDDLTHADAVLAAMEEVLGLSVKFVEWWSEVECCTQFPEQHPELFDENETEPGYTSHSLKDTKVLFRYWIDKIYKPE